MNEQITGVQIFFGLLMLAFAIWAGLEYWTLAEQARITSGDPVSTMSAGELRLAQPYLNARASFMARWWFYGPLIVAVPMVLFLLARRFAAWNSSLRAKIAGMDFKLESDMLPNAVAAKATSLKEEVQLTQRAFVTSLSELGDGSEKAVILGLDREGQPVMMSDRQRSMHMQILGQTGSGKTASVIYPMMFQDARRLWFDPQTKKKVHRTVVLVDAKGSIENEHTLTAIASATGRLDNHRIFTLNPKSKTHTYNPVYMSPGDDPKQVAERVFSTFEDLTEGYFRDMAFELFSNLVVALASTGKQMTMLDIRACIASRDVMAHALTLCTDKAAVNTIKASYEALGDKVGETYTGLLAAVSRYDHPAINVYNPDIILDDLFQEGAIVGFSLSANAYKFQAKALGLIVLQHIQHIGAQRQMDRTICQAPAYIYADEFFNFAYAGFVDAVNKLRDAHLAMILSHQSMSDLLLVSAEFAQGISDNTRNKVILYQSDGDLCDALAGGVGTRKNVVQTVRKSTDAFLNAENMMEASSREVDEYILHPNQIKHLKMGQAYLVQSGLAEVEYHESCWWKWWKKAPAPAPPTVAVGTNLPLMMDLPSAEPKAPVSRDTTSGLGFHNMFVRGGL